jgi:Family of unknown function (DUF6526)
MADTMPQTFENHTRLIPAFHMVALPILTVNVLWTAYALVRFPAATTALTTLVAIALLIVAIYARGFALTAQDRIIRLEMQLRLARLLPREQQASIDSLTRDQMIALRFASDGELPDLCRQVVDEKIMDRKRIKQMIKVWKGDYLRV